MSEALKPCPFCGGQAKIHIGLHSFTDAIVECSECNSEGALQDEEEDNPEEKVSKAIAAWNRRSSSPILLPLTPAEYQEVRRWLGCPGHDGKRVLGEGLTGEGMLTFRRKVEALAFDMEIPSE